MAATAITTPREWDAQGNPVQNAPAPMREWDASGTPVGPSSAPNAPPRPSQPQESGLGELLDMGRLGTALVYSKLLGTDPHFAYMNHDNITEQLTKIAPDFMQRMGKAATVKDDPLYMIMKQRGPEPFESHDMLENFVHDVSEFIGDPAIYGPAIAGTLLGSPRAGADVGFVLDASLRKMLTDHYQKGDIKSFGELANRTATTLWEATKGLITGEVMHFAGGLPVPKSAGPMAANALRGLYQSSAMTTAGAVLNWQVPTLESFERNAVTVTGLNLVTHAVGTVVEPNTKQGLLDVYAKDGTTPEQSATSSKLNHP